MTKPRRIAVRLVLVLVGLELACYLALARVKRSAFPLGAIRGERTAVAATGMAAADVDDTGDEGDEGAMPLRVREQAIHPYVGYVFDPAFNSPANIVKMGGRKITEMGFMGAAGFLEPAGPDRVVIGIAGGSVAAFFSIHGLAPLVEALREAPELADKEIVFVTTALLGYKQPQQLFALGYCLALGGHFDMVVNIDGFNEVALPYVENIPAGTAAIFPRSWSWRVEDVPDPIARRLMGRVAYLEEARAGWARAFSRALFSFDPACNLIWKLRSDSMGHAIRRAETQLRELRPGEASFLARGPAREYRNDEELFEDLTDIWFRCSLQMHRLSEANGIRYYHFLQPNQYVPDTKPMSDAERRVATNPPSSFKEPVEKGYGLLVDKGAELAAAGVRFQDLTQAFADVTEPLYTDNCCHFNEEGNRILAELIARAILEDL